MAASKRKVSVEIRILISGSSHLYVTSRLYKKTSFSNGQWRLTIRFWITGGRPAFGLFRLSIMQAVTCGRGCLKREMLQILKLRLHKLDTGNCCLIFFYFEPAGECRGSILFRPSHSNTIRLSCILLQIPLLVEL